jgi:hypothetical protein
MEKMEEGITRKLHEMEINRNEMRQEKKDAKESLGAGAEAGNGPPNGSMEQLQDVIVLGGREPHGHSLGSAERYIFREGRWIELPSMNTPRSFLSSVVVDNEIVVSGGDTGTVMTDSIETLNLDEIPLHWITSPAKLPVPLSGHSTVIYQGKLIVIGGHDDSQGRNSDKIYEVLLSPPYSTEVLSSLPQPRGWHGAEMVDGKIFIFGGGRNPTVPSNHVLVYNPVTNQCSEMPNLPYRVQGMATVCQGSKVILLGGVDGESEELDRVIMYDTRSGETTRLPAMRHRRGGCSAVITRSDDCSAAMSTDTCIVALGCLNNEENTVEFYNFRTHTWNNMPPTTVAREFCATIVSSETFESD